MEKLFGVIEGFYGRTWSWHQRMELMTLMSQWHMNAYIYAPKSDVYLRRRWREHWEPEIFESLQKLARHATLSGVSFGVGLSLLNYNHKQDQDVLVEKINVLNSLDLTCLGVFFDDMRGDDPLLADQQVDAVKLIRKHSLAKQIIFCPTYYSFDPVLEEIFGVCPDNYWSTLIKAIPAEVQMFWTGSKVVSPQINVDDLVAAFRLMGRRPAIWDNYPVNDGRLTSRFLNLRPSPKRNVMNSHYSAYFINPMNQFELSLPVLASAYFAIHGGKDSYIEAMRFASQRWGQDFAEFWWESTSAVQDKGLDQMSLELHDLMMLKLAKFDNSAATEWLDWMSGGYQFDPTCLTD